VVRFLPRILHLREEPPVPVELEDGWAPEPVGTVYGEQKKSLVPAGNRNHDGTTYSLAARPTALTEVVDGFMIRPDIVFYIPSRACRRHQWNAKYRFCGAAIFFVKK
jgi:hypothetical protein